MPRPVDRVPRRELKDADPFAHYLLTLIGNSLLFNIDKVHSAPTVEESRLVERMELSSQTRVFPAVGKLLNAELQSSFFDAIVLERPQIAELASLLAQPYLVLLHGLTGTGKTVVCRAALEKHRRDFASTNTNSVPLYLDVKASVKEIGEQIDDEDFQQGALNSGMDSLVRKLILTQPNAANRLIALRVAAQWARDNLTPAEYRSLTNDEFGLADFDRMQGSKEAVLRLAKDARVPPERLIEALKEAGATLCIALDNVDRLRIRVQQMLLQYSIDLVNATSVAVVFCARTPNLSRLHPEGIKGDYVWRLSLEIAAGLTREDLEKTLDEHNWSLTGSSEVLGANELSTILKSRLQFVFQRDYVRRFFTTFFPNQAESALGLVERDGRITHVEFDRLHYGLNRATEFWCTKCGLLHYFNGGIREAASFLGTMLYRIILGVDSGCDFEAMFLLGDNQDSRRSESRWRNFFLRCLCVGKERIPHRLEIYNCFDDLFSSGTFLGLGSIRMILSDQWHTATLKVDEIKDRWSSIGQSTELLITSLAKLAQSSAHGAHGALICRGLSSNGALGPDHDGNVEILPAGLHLDIEVVTSLEYLFWTLLFAEWPDSAYERLDIGVLAKVSGDFNLQHKARFTVRALEVVYAEFLSENISAMEANSDGNWRRARWSGPEILRRMVHRVEGLLNVVASPETEGDLKRLTALREHLEARFHGI